MILASEDQYDTDLKIEKLKVMCRWKTLTEEIVIHFSCFGEETVYVELVPRTKR